MTDFLVQASNTAGETPPSHNHLVGVLLERASKIAAHTQRKDPPSQAERLNDLEPLPAVSLPTSKP